MSFASLSDVVTSDRTSFLPESAESTHVASVQADFLGSDSIPAIVVIENSNGLSPTDKQAVASFQEKLPEILGQDVQTSPPIPSEDGKAIELIIPIPSSMDAGDAVESLREGITQATDSSPGLRSWVSGPAGFTADLLEAFSGIDGLLLVVAIAVVAVILLIVYRTPILPIITLLTSLTALCFSVLLTVLLARSGIITVNGQVQGILFILVIGTATDYSLLLIARFKEKIAHAPKERAFTAALAALKEVTPTILVSAGTVAAGIFCLTFSDLRSNAALGPVGAIGVLCAALTSLTFLTAFLVLLGRHAFWPSKKYAAHASAASADPTDASAHGVWARIASTVRQRPRAWAGGLTVLLALGCAGIPALDAQGVPTSELVVGYSEAREGNEILREHFPQDSASPAYILTKASDMAEVADLARDTEGIADVSVTSADSPSGFLPLGPDGAPIPMGPKAAEPTRIDGQVMLQASLADSAESPAAENTVRTLRERLASLEATTYVGGETATTIDTNDTAIHDRNLIIPIVLAVILVLLALLLRAIVAPILLLIATVLSFGFALGVSSWVLSAMGMGQADPSVPLYGFIFLVALGIDYSIFLASRIRQEALEHGHESGTLRALTLTGGVITSAGVVLAATFAALAVVPIQFLVQLAVIVGFGVLVDTLLVRSFLVPATSLLSGRRFWWPWTKVES